MCFRTHIVEGIPRAAHDCAAAQLGRAASSEAPGEKPHQVGGVEHGRWPQRDCEGGAVGLLPQRLLHLDQLPPVRRQLLLRLPAVSLVDMSSNKTLTLCRPRRPDYEWWQQIADSGPACLPGLVQQQVSRRAQQCQQGKRVSWSAGTGLTAVCRCARPG